MQADLLSKTVLSKLKKQSGTLHLKVFGKQNHQKCFDYAKQAWSDPFSILSTLFPSIVCFMWLVIPALSGDVFSSTFLR